MIFLNLHHTILMHLQLTQIAKDVENKGGYLYEIPLSWKSSSAYM